MPDNAVLYTILTDFRLRTSGYPVFKEETRMRKNANAKVFCTREQDKLNFYLMAEAQEFYLFSTNYHSEPIYLEYANGRRVNYLFRNSRKCRQQNIRSRAIRMLSYIEKEYHLELFDKTKNQNQNKFKS